MSEDLKEYISEARKAKEELKEGLKECFAIDSEAEHILGIEKKHEK